MNQDHDASQSDMDETIPTNLNQRPGNTGAGADLDATIPMAAPDSDQTVATNVDTDNMDTIGMAPTLPGSFNDSDTAATQMSPQQMRAGANGDDLTGQIWGDFELGKKIGQGGMGAVYLGRQVSLDRSVAIKVLPTHLSHDDSFRKRFELEAKAVAQITSPYIIQVYGAGMHAGHSYFAMEFVEGKDLSERIKDGLRPTLEESANFILQAARGLATAGEHNLIHRDIKPGNMMVTDKGELKIMDFGLVKLKNEDGSSGGGLTMAGAVMGTVNYFSPEQGRGEECDQTTDIYALGVVFYQLLAGALPFAGSDATAIIYQHIHAEPRALKDINPGIPESYQAIVSKCLQKDRRKRYQSAHELIKDLKLIIDGAKPQHAPINETSTTTTGSVADKKGSNVGIIVLLLLIIAGGAGYYYWDQVLNKQQGGDVISPVGPVAPQRNPNTHLDPKVKAGELLGRNELGEAETLITQFLSLHPGDSEWLDLSKRLRQLRGEGAVKDARKAINVEDFELAAGKLDDAEELGADKQIIEELRGTIRKHSGLAVKLDVIKSHLMAGLPLKALAELDEIGVGDARADAKVLKELRSSADKMKGELETAHKTLASGDIDTARGLFQASLNAYPNAAARNGLKALAPASTINRALNDNQVALAQEQMRELKVLIPDSMAIAAIESKIAIVSLFVDGRQAAKRGDLKLANELLAKLTKQAADTAREKELQDYIKERETLAAFRLAVVNKDLADAKKQMELLDKMSPESESVQIVRREYRESRIEEEASKKQAELFEAKIKAKADNIQSLIAAAQPDFKAVDQGMKDLVALAGSDRAELATLKVSLEDRRADLGVRSSLLAIDKAVLAGDAAALPSLIADEKFTAVLGSFIGKNDLVFKNTVQSVKRSGEEATVDALLTNGYDVAPENDIKVRYQFKRQESDWRLQSFKINP